MTPIAGPRGRWASRRLLLLPAAAVIGLAIEATATGPVDTYQDTVHDGIAALAWLVRALTAVSPVVVAGLLAVSVLHHVAGAIAARAAAGATMPGVELLAAQYAASAANRVTPAGLGGAGLLGRYFCRRGALAPAGATAAVSTLAALGALADLAAFGALLLVGALLGAASMTRETPMLLVRITGLVRIPAGWARWTLIAVLVLGAAIAVISYRKVPAMARKVGVVLGRFVAAVAVIARSPGRLAALTTASAATTLLLAAGFASAAILVAGGLPAHDFGAVMIGYMLASAAGNALPTPGGIGSADAALVGVLLAAAMPTALSVAVVLVFRLVTYWVPAAIGLVVVPVLRRRGAL